MGPSRYLVTARLRATYLHCCSYVDICAGRSRSRVPAIHPLSHPTGSLSSLLGTLVLKVEWSDEYESILVYYYDVQAVASRGKAEADLDDEDEDVEASSIKEV